MHHKKECQGQKMEPLKDLKSTENTDSVSVLMFCRKQLFIFIYLYIYRQFHKEPLLSK